MRYPYRLITADFFTYEWEESTFNGKIYLIQELYNNHRFKEKLDKILVKRFETSTYEPNYISALEYIATELEHLQGYH